MVHAPRVLLPIRLSLLLMNEYLTPQRIAAPSGRFTLWNPNQFEKLRKRLPSTHKSTDRPSMPESHIKTRLHCMTQAIMRYATPCPESLLSPEWICECLYCLTLTRTHCRQTIALPRSHSHLGHPLQTPPAQATLAAFVCH